MDCLHAQTLLNASLDGELESAEEAAALEAHLASCSECRAAAEQLRAQDAELHRAFAPLRSVSGPLAERVIGALHADTTSPAQAAVAGKPRWPLFLAATAAGYLLAVFTWQSPEVRQQQAFPPPAPPVARLAVATGPVEFQPPQKLEWFACPTSSDLASGAAVRTDANTRCEITTRDGSQVRLNGDTQIQLPGDREIELTRGQLWSHVSQGDQPFAVRLPAARVTAQQGKLSVTCQPEQSVVTVVEGTARIEGTGRTQDVAAGHSATITDGQLSEVQRVHDTALVTSWINELLALKGPDDPEFNARMNDILAQVGQAKMSHLYEEEIRRLGDHCVLPLVRYLESSRSDGDSAKRIKAAGIVADVAQPRSIPLLIELLADQDPQVRFHAARGLERLTAQDQGRPPAQWKSEPWANCAPTHRAWLDWWETNRHRYPAGPELKQPLKKG